MQALRYDEYGGPEALHVAEVDRPEPEENEVLVEVRAAGVNPADAKVCQGTYQADRGDGQVPLPRIPGSDFAGVVEATGRGVTEFSPGDRVVGTGLHNDRQFGSHAEYVAAPTDRIARLPESVDYETAGAIALAGVTAWRALIDRAQVTSTDTCLIHGGSGGVGHVAVQIAAETGATVVATAGSDRACERIESLGAHRSLRYDRGDLEGGVLDASGGGVDVVLDLYVDEYTTFNVAVANPMARIVVVGGRRIELDAPLAKRKELTMHYVGISNLNAYASLPTMGEVLEPVVKMVADGGLVVHVSATCSLDEAPEAYRRVLEGGFFGKLLVTP